MFIVYGAKYRVYFESLSTKKTSVDMTNSSISTDYSAGFKMDSSAGQIQDIDVVISGPGIGDGTEAGGERMTWVSGIGSYAFQKQVYIDSSDGSFSDTLKDWPGTSTPRYNNNANFLEISTVSVSKMKIENEYTIKFLDTANSDVEVNKFTVIVPKPIPLNADNESEYVVALDNASSYCTSPPSQISGNVPSGVKLISAGMNYWVSNTTVGDSRRLDFSVNRVELVGNFTQASTFSGGPAYDSESGDSVGHFSSWLWLEDTYYRNFSVEFECHY